MGRSLCASPTPLSLANPGSVVPPMDEALFAAVSRLQISDQQTQRTAKQIQLELASEPDWANVSVSEVKRACSKLAKRRAAASSQSKMQPHRDADCPPAHTPRVGGPAQCWGCGAVEGDAERFLACGRCVEEKQAPSFFCSKKCQADSWPRHREWHKSQRALATKLDGWHGATGGEVAQREQARAVEGGDPYLILVTNAQALMNDGNIKKAQKKLQQATAMEPTRAQAYLMLSSLYRRSVDEARGLQMALKALEVSEKARDGCHWSKSVFIVASYRDELECVESPPQWVTNDEELLRVSAAVVEVADHFSGSHHYTEIEEFQAVMLRAWSLLVGVMEFSSTERMSKRLQAAAFPPRTSAHRDEFIQCVSRMRSLAKLPWAHDEFARLMRVTGLADMLCQAAGKEDRLGWIASHSSALP